MSRAVGSILIPALILGALSFLGSCNGGSGGNGDAQETAEESGTVTDGDAPQPWEARDWVPSDYTPEPGLPPGWPMAGANPQRTSWVPEEVKGRLAPVWYRPMQPYIPQQAQLVAAYDTIYVSTARGLYALDYQTGAERAT